MVAAEERDEAPGEDDDENGDREVASARWPWIMTPRRPVLWRLGMVVEVDMVAAVGGMDGDGAFIQATVLDTTMCKWNRWVQNRFSLFNF